MAKVKVYNQEGKAQSEMDLKPEIFDVVAKESVIHQVVVGLMANARQTLVHTKTKGEVRGGGKKPWAQKGTGRARQGSIRNPQWVGGGIAFGPRKERSYKQKINKKMRQKSYFMCLSDKVKNGNLVVVENFEIKNAKTKDMVSMIKKLPVGEKTLLALPVLDEKIVRSIKNIPWVRTILVNNLNTLEVLKYKYLLMPVESIKKIEEMYIK
jgi:large subunit ribosomal protein L4